MFSECLYHAAERAMVRWGRREAGVLNNKPKFERKWDNRLQPGVLG